LVKNEGDRIEKGESVIEVETDKIVSEIEAPESGILANILYHENDEAPVTKVVAYILKEGESLDSIPIGEKTVETTISKPEEASKDTVTAKSTLHATPLAEKVSKDLGVQLEQVSPSGSKVTRKDVEAFAERMKEQVTPRVSVPATPAARSLAEERGIDLGVLSGSGPRGRIQAADVPMQAPTTIFRAGVTTSVPLVGKRKRIAERLTASYQSTPHIYITVEVDMTSSESARKQINMLAEKEGQLAISVTAFLVKMVTWALGRHPYLNASLQDDKILLSEDANIGIATAIDDGLIVPVIHSANKLSLREINTQLRYLTNQARTGALTAEQVTGGTFTISNLGMFGIGSFTAIINPPQSAILAVGGLVRKPVVVDENDTIAVRPMMNLTLGADHRVVDGAVAASFLADLVTVLETPELVLY
jgi:Pyruvate/2-oxoglutarate dehydrogenase complex, dihydrolipoamide acyltransferase (E2) component, and related enzymes